MGRYTAFIGIGQVDEEIDVDAPDMETARKLAQEEVDQNYVNGVTIFNIEERFGLYI